MIAGRGRGDVSAGEDMVGYKEAREREREKERESKMGEKSRGTRSERERKLK